jgi:UDPglucose 6-dehydrogenase
VSESKPIVGFAGMTHLGLCSAIAAAGQGFETVAFDLDEALVVGLRQGKLPVSEPGLDDLLKANRERLTFTDSILDLRRCDLIYFALDVSTDETGESDDSELDMLLNQVLTVSRRPDAVVVILSQVSPGYTRVWQGSDRIVGYQVETLIFGRAVERATKPERFILGVADPSKPLPTAWQTFLASFGCPILPMRFESAELAKIAINCCLVASVSVANTLAELCEKIGADWSEIAPALKLDRRIGLYSYLSPGLGIAGGNLERDLATVERLSLEHGTDAGVIRAFFANSRYRKDWALRTLQQSFPVAQGKGPVAVLGLTYKENTHSLKNSASISLIGNLGNQDVRAYDPAASKVEFGPSFTRCTDVNSALDGAEALLIMTPWAEFKSLQPADIAKRMRGRLVIDPFRVLQPAEAKAAGLDHRTLGVV